MVASHAWNEKQAGLLAGEVVQQLEDDFLQNKIRIVQANSRQEVIIEEEQEYLGILTIPRLSLSLPVRNEWNEQLLKEAPCRYQGTIAEDSLVIMAHNYKTHFGPIYRLGYKDQINLIDYNGNSVDYEVVGIETLEARAG